MKYKVRRLFFNFEKEEQWLNNMAAKGMHLTSFLYPRYEFTEGKPGEYIYRIELLDELPAHPESRAYLRFMEENGIECVATFMRWVYFRKRAEDGPFDLYSDNTSKIKHYKRVSGLVAFAAGFNVVAALVNLTIGLINGSAGEGYHNSYLSIINFAIGVFLFYLLFIVYWRRIKKLKKDQLIHE